MAKVNKEIMNKWVEEKLTEIETSLDMVAQPFDGIETLYKQEKYYTEQLGYVVRKSRENYVASYSYAL